MHSSNEKRQRLILNFDLTLIQGQVHSFKKGHKVFHLVKRLENSLLIGVGVVWQFRLIKVGKVPKHRKLCLILQQRCNWPPPRGHNTQRDVTIVFLGFIWFHYLLFHMGSILELTDLSFYGRKYSFILARKQIGFYRSYQRVF